MSTDEYGYDTYEQKPYSYGVPEEDENEDEEEDREVKKVKTDSSPPYYSSLFYLYLFLIL